MGIQRQPCCCDTAIFAIGDDPGSTGATTEWDVFAVDLASGSARQIATFQRSTAHQVFSIGLLPDGTVAGIGLDASVDLKYHVTVDMDIDAANWGTALNLPGQVLYDNVHSPSSVKMFAGGFAAVNNATIYTLARSFWKSSYESSFYLFSVDRASGVFSQVNVGTEVAPITYQAGPSTRTSDVYGGVAFQSPTFDANGRLYAVLAWTPFSDAATAGVGRAELWQINPADGIGVKIRDMAEFSPPWTIKSQPVLGMSRNPHSDEFFVIYKTFWIDSLGDTTATIWRSEHPTLPFTKITPIDQAFANGDLPAGGVIIR